MGCSASSSTSVHRVATGRSPPSSPSLHRYDDHERGYNFFKVILIGTGESGKSTIFKQLCRYPIGGRHNIWNDPEQRRSYRHIMYNNVIAAITLLVRQSENATELVVSLRDRHLHSLSCSVQSSQQTPCFICRPTSGVTATAASITSNNNNNNGINGNGNGHTSAAVGSSSAITANGNEVIFLLPFRYPPEELELQAAAYRLDASFKPFIDAIKDAALFRDDWFDAKIPSESKLALDLEHVNVEHDTLVERLMMLHITNVRPICDLIADYIEPPIYDLTYIIHRLWNTKAIQNVWSARSVYHISESSAYYFDRILQLGAITPPINSDKTAAIILPPKSSGYTTSTSTYLPSMEECFQTRVRTCGIVEAAVDLPPIKLDQRRAPDITGTELKYALKVFDVGGQRWERKKWIHMFENVDVAVITTSLNEFDLNLFEDDTTKRMHESVHLFDELIGSKWFRDTIVCLVFSQDDLFRKKLVSYGDRAASEMKRTFPDYDGDGSYESSLSYIKQQFHKRINNGSGAHIGHISHINGNNGTTNGISTNGSHGNGNGNGTANDGSRRVHRTFVVNLLDCDAVTHMFQSVFTELKERLKSSAKR